MKGFLFILIAFLFVGCAQKVDTTTLAFDPNLIQNEYNTYDAKEGKISTYFFKNTNEGLHVNSFMTYIPIDSDGQFYSPFSTLPLTLRKYSTNRDVKIEDVLAQNAEKLGNHKLFKDKNELIIDNDLAFDIRREIKEYEERQQRDDRNDDGDGGIIILP